MKITRKQLRKIIKEYTSNPAFYGKEEQGFSHPALKDSYAGNGHVPAQGFKGLVPAMEEIGDPMYEPAIGIAQGKFQDSGRQLFYIPFIYGDKVLVSLQKALDSGSAPASLTQELIDRAGYELDSEDYEHSPPGW